MRRSPQATSKEIVEPVGRPRTGVFHVKRTNAIYVTARRVGIDDFIELCVLALNEAHIQLIGFVAHRISRWVLKKWGAAHRSDDVLRHEKKPTIYRGRKASWTKRAVAQATLCNRCRCTKQPS